MKKRLVAAVLCTLMIVASLVGCNKNYTPSTNDVNAMTVVIAMVADEIPTDEAVQAVEKELTGITSQLYNIAVELEFYTPDQYRAAMYKKFENLNTDFEQGALGSSIDAENSYIINEFGRQEVKYPDTYKNQVDILLVSDSTMLREFADNGWLYPLNGADCMSSTNGEGALVKKYLSEKIRRYGGYNGSTYAIPGNPVNTDYKYLLLDKQLYDEYGVLPAEQISGLDSIKDYLLEVSNNESNVIPLYNIVDLGVTGFTSSNTVLGQYISEIDQSAILTGKISPRNILDLLEVKSQISVICDIIKEGAQMPKQTSDVDFSESFGACFVYGTPESVKQYENDYYAIPVSKPMATTESTYSSMYGISAFSSSPSRAFQVLSLMYTKAEFVNTLLYGVENEHYTLDVNGSVVTRIENSGYKIDRYSVGNTFITKQSTDMTAEELELSANDWALGKKIMGDLLLSPYIGFELDYSLEPISGISVSDMDAHLEMLYDELWIKIAQYPDTIDETTGESITFDVFYRSLGNWINSDPYFIAASAEEKEAITSYYNQYLNWYNAMNNINEEEDVA